MADVKANNYQFTFNRENNVKQIYTLIVEGNAMDELFVALSKNFVRPGEIVAKSLNKEMGLQCGKNVVFEKETGYYRSSAWGYVHYEGLIAIETLPVAYINDDRYKAMVILPPQNEVKQTLQIEEVMGMVALFNIKLGVNYEAIDAAVTDSLAYNKGVAVVFAEGRAPVEGRVSKVVLDYNFNFDVGQEKEDGKIDFKERNFVNNVKEGQKIAHYIPPIEPIDGINIDGNIIKAALDKDPVYRLGKNVTGNQETGEIIASIDGILSVANGVIAVNDVMEISRDVDYATGNLKANGSILIHGTVKPGFEVRAEGDVIVYGNIEEATVSSGGNVIARGGIIGSANVAIEARGNVKANFIRSAQIKCFGDIVVDQSIMNAEIVTDGRVICQSGKGVIIGGHISASKGIFANVTGTPSGTPTDLAVGKSINYDTRLREINEGIKNNKEQIKKLKQVLGDDYFRNPKEFLMRLNPQRAPLIKQVLQQLTAIVRQNNEMEIEKESLISKAGEDSRSVLSVYDTVNEGTFIAINRERREIEKSQSGVEFFYAKEYGKISERPPRKLNPKEYEF